MTRSPSPHETAPRTGVKGFFRRRWVRVIGGIVLAFAVFTVALLFVDEPLRRQMERRMNDKLQGYQVEIPRLHLSLLGGSITLRDLKVRQVANPEPPILLLPYLKASVQWRELLSGRLVADFRLERPQVHINLIQLQQEQANPTPVKDQGWQDAVEQIYPLKINLVRIHDAHVVYIDKDPKNPLTLSHLELVANNIRNIHSADRDYPSPFHASGVVFDTGRASVDGHADFLAKPIPSVQTAFRVENVPMAAARAVIARANLDLRGGTFGVNGDLEYSPKVKTARVANLTVRDLHLDYIHTAATASAEAARKDQVVSAAKQASKSEIALSLEELEVSRSTLGFVNRAAKPNYRVYMADTRISLHNVTNQNGLGPARGQLSGRFMGSGPARGKAVFHPGKAGPNFDLDLQVEGTSLETLNDMLRAHGGFDVSKGTFSVYSQVRVQDQQLSGYVKPFFKDVNVYDRQMDKDKSFFRRLYERLVGLAARILENRRDEVATKVELRGSLNDPNSNIWQVIGRLLQNAFIRALLPGFDRGAPAPAGDPKKAEKDQPPPKKQKPAEKPEAPKAKPKVEAPA
ncbi:DUF748 domain-containing protein [Geothrix sp. 21YS21S-4]|uniref:AsmA family protein n=1 Tax=Geothrix sp. 21YS21S-4 TaxID=3068889 RepID=UPI0027B89D3C|nr:DUF748 domain-containing protein [Geothrix sp. 21YS21S-4]